MLTSPSRPVAEMEIAAFQQVEACKWLYTYVHAGKFVVIHVYTYCCLPTVALHVPAQLHSTQFVSTVWQSAQVVLSRALVSGHCNSKALLQAPAEACFSLHQNAWNFLPKICEPRSLRI